MERRVLIAVCHNFKRDLRKTEIFVANLAKDSSGEDQSKSLPVRKTGGRTSHFRKSQNSLDFLKSSQWISQIICVKKAFRPTMKEFTASPAFILYKLRWIIFFLEMHFGMSFSCKMNLKNQRLKDNMHNYVQNNHPHITKVQMA